MKHKHHIIPKYMGGTDNPDNLELLTIEEHAIAHKKLYEKYNNWEDKLAWHGLSGMISKEELIKTLLHESAKKGAKIANEKMANMKIDPRKGKAGNKSGEGVFIKGNQITAKNYLLKNPEGIMVKVKGLSKWCRENGFIMGSFWKQVIERKGQHKGWTLWDKYGKI